MSDLPERLRALADAIQGCDWELPITAREDCLLAAEEIERLRAELHIREQEVFCVRNSQSLELFAAKNEIERLSEAVRVRGGCRMLSDGKDCDCGLCIRDKEIERLRGALLTCQSLAVGRSRLTLLDRCVKICEVTNEVLAARAAGGKDE